MDDDVLLFETADRVRTLTLNRPAARNALSAELMTRLSAALAEAEADDGIAAVVLTGTDPAFCAGLDLRAPAASTPISSSTRNGPRGGCSAPCAPR
jgi:enoyl-CoA hydratase